MEVLFDQFAKFELDDFTEYYELEMPGLGIRFKDEVKHGIYRICDSPHAWLKEKGDVRRYILHKFPYKILYSVEKEYIYIIAIAHCHRKPEYWIDRIK